jgi:4-amino-4-deoxy-L-arabinose transferase-like glycosyltransferase
MNSAQQSTSLLAADTLEHEAAPAARTLRGARVRAEHVALGAVLALSAVLNIHHLSRNEWANTFYSAAVKSMLGSLHNFVFVSFDPGGLITVDKPPLGLWVQALSAKLFGFTPLSLLLPEALAGVLSVAALYWVVRPRFGPAAAVASALALAVFPSFVAVARDNNLDALLILLMVLACGVGLRAIESGRLLPLLGCALLVGLAFNTKTLAAYLVVPGLALAYLVCAPNTIARRLAHLLAAGAVLLAVSASWIAFVELTPASKRPFIGGSTNNTELGLTFGYNGFGRVGGQVGGPGQIPVVLRHGSLAHIEIETLRLRARERGLVIPPPPRPRAKRHPKPPAPKYLPNGRAIHPTSFGGATGPLRLWGIGLGSQSAWLLAFALFGMLALGLWSIRAPGTEPGQDGGRRDPRIAGLIVLGGWFLVEAGTLSFSKGIVHPYYTSALGPGSAAMVGAGAVAFVARGPRLPLRLALLPLAVAGTVASEIVLLHEDEYMRWFWPLLAGGALAGVFATLASRRWARPAMALTLALLLLAPCAYAATTWQFPVEGTFPAAGPRAAGSAGRYGVTPAAYAVNGELIRYLTPRHPAKRFFMLTEASDSAATMILLNHDGGAMGGYSGNDPALDGRSLARLVRRGEARYVALGGAYAERGGNAASTAVLYACTLIPTADWMPPPVNRNALLLYDCKGRERELELAHGRLHGLG